MQRDGQSSAMEIRQLSKAALGPCPLSVLAEIRKRAIDVRSTGDCDRQRASNEISASRITRRVNVRHFSGDAGCISRSVYTIQPRLSGRELLVRWEPAVGVAAAHISEDLASDAH